MRDPAERLRDILDAIAAIERHFGEGRAAFEQDELLQTWFLHHLQIIGEAMRALPEEVRALSPGIPWPQVIGMRNILVHGYFDIDAEAVWNTVAEGIPVLKPQVQELLRRLEGDA